MNNAYIWNSIFVAKKQYICDIIMNGKKMISIDDKIIVKVRSAKRGALFFVQDFIIFGTSKAVAKALERLVAKGDMTRVARGIYAQLKEDPILGVIAPTAEEIAEAISRRDNARVTPTGILALNALGLSTQVPMNIVFLTDGADRAIQIGKQKIIFKRTSPRNLAAIGPISSLVIQALREIGKDKVTKDDIKSILQCLKKEAPYRLLHDIKLAPEWIRVIMRQALKTDVNE